jgi:hypothetical protein
MTKHWKDVKDEIEREIDKIWWEEPIEVKMSKNGVFPSGAGAHGYYLGNLFFQVCDTQAMGWWTAVPAIQQALEDDFFTLEHCKRMWKYINFHMAHLMGDRSGENCPAPWLNLPKFSQFADDIVDSFGTIQTKDEFRDLIWSWQNYVNCINRWFQTVFPWELGGQLKVRTLDYIDELKQYHKVFE